jgi:hypothetical protein
MPDLKPGYNLIRMFLGLLRGYRPSRSEASNPEQQTGGWLLGRCALRKDGGTARPRQGTDRCLTKARLENGYWSPVAAPARCCDGTPLCRSWCRADHLRPASGGHRRADTQRSRWQGRRDQVRYSRWRGGRCHDGRELARCAARCSRQQRRSRAGYVNGEMVVQEGGAHLRSSGAEDLLQWSDTQWEQQRPVRSKA